MIEMALVEFLNGVPEVAALVGGRIYPDVLPEGVVYPAVEFQRISTQRERSLGTRSGLAHPRFQLTVWAETRLETLNVARALQAALDGASGDWPFDGGSVAVDDVELVDERGLYEVAPRTFGEQLDFVIHHAE